MTKQTPQSTFFRGIFTAYPCMIFVCANCTRLVLNQRFLIVRAPLIFVCAWHRLVLNQRFFDDGCITYLCTLIFILPLWQCCHKVVVDVVTTLWHDRKWELCRRQFPTLWQRHSPTLTKRYHNVATRLSIGFLDHFITVYSDFFPVIET